MEKRNAAKQSAVPVILSIYSVILSKAKDLFNRFFRLRLQNDQPVILNFSEKQLRHCRNVFFVILRMFQDLIDCHGNQRFPRNDECLLHAHLMKEKAEVLSERSELSESFFLNLVCHLQEYKDASRGFFSFVSFSFLGISAYERPRKENEKVFRLFKNYSARRALAFSLIELLISLIIISLLIAAFTPLITKKLKASDITVGSFGKGDNVSTNITRSPTKEDCDAVGALFIPAAFNGENGRSICVTKFNVGDNIEEGGVPFSDAVEVIPSGTVCPNDKLGYCCWQGNTSGSCSNDENYSGCTRTLCQWSAGNSSCASYNPDGKTLGSWRLPKESETIGWKDNISELVLNKGKDGLQLCSEGTSAYVQCGTKENSCPTSTTYTNRHCLPHVLSTSTPVTSGGAGYVRFEIIDGIANVVANNHQYYGNSVRCVLDSITEELKAPIGSNSIEDNYDKLQKDEPDKETCEKFNTFFLDKNVSGFSRNLCITKYNVGDGGNIYSPQVAVTQGVIGLSINNTCSSGQACCWSGQTGDPSGECSAGKCSTGGNGDSTYSGCTRTVCNYQGGKTSCLAWAPKNTKPGYWRLLTFIEGAKISSLLQEEQYNPTISRNLGQEGLQICQETSSDTGYTNCAHKHYYCKGSVPAHAGGYGENTCYPERLWLEGPNAIYVSYFTYHSGKGMIMTDQPANAAYSVRCVYDGLPHSEELISKSKQEICDKYNALYVPAKYNGSGGVDLCVTKYNVGDNKGPTFANWSNLGITMLNTNETCKSEKCCWQGNTSANCNNSGNGDSDYDGCTRSVCTYYAAVEACNFWAPEGTKKGDWRIPLYSEIQGWVSATNSESLNNPIISRWFGSAGLQFCDSATNTSGSARCSDNSGYCRTSSYSQCNPYAVWADGVHAYSLTSGASRYNTNWNILEVASSRCVSSAVLQ